MSLSEIAYSTSGSRRRPADGAGQAPDQRFVMHSRYVDYRCDGAETASAESWRCLCADRARRGQKPDGGVDVDNSGANNEPV